MGGKRGGRRRPASESVRPSHFLRAGANQHSQVLVRNLHVVGSGGERELGLRCRHCKVRRRAQARHNPSELPVQHPSEPLDQLASSLLPPSLSQCRRRDDEQADRETRKDAVARHFESD